MGADPLEAAKVEMWSRRVEFQMMMPIAAVARHGIPAMAALEHNEQCPEWAAANDSRVEKGIAWLEASLTGKDFLAGDRFKRCGYYGDHDAGLYAFDPQKGA